MNDDDDECVEGGIDEAKEKIKSGTRGNTLSINAWESVYNIHEEASSEPEKRGEEKRVKGSKNKDKAPSREKEKKKNHYSDIHSCFSLYFYSLYLYSFYTKEVGTTMTKDERKKGKAGE